MSEIIPWERVASGNARKLKTPTMLVDVRRCIGCHACSVACKVEHNVPLGDFRMRVRWLPRPDKPGISFLPLFDADKCDFGANRGSVGLDPACVAACPTAALKFGDADDAASTVAKESKRHGAKPFTSPAKTRDGVVYIGVEPWHASKVNAGVPLSKNDEDIIYEQ
jgi:Fe-S-cluster-containing dehydrogenase component